MLSPAHSILPLEYPLPDLFNLLLIPALTTYQPSPLVSNRWRHREFNIEQEINLTKGDIAYTVLDLGNVEEDPARLQVRGSSWAAP